MHERNTGNTAPVTEWRAFRAANPDIEFIDAFVIDINGNTAGKRLPAADGEKLYQDGVMFSACSPIADCRGWGHNAGGLGRGGGGGFFLLLGLDHVDAGFRQHRHRVLDLLGGHLVGRQGGVQLVIGDVASLLALLDELLELGAKGIEQGGIWALFAGI